MINVHRVEVVYTQAPNETGVEWWPFLVSAGRRP